MWISVLKCNISSYSNIVFVLWLYLTGVRLPMEHAPPTATGDGNSATGDTGEQQSNAITADMDASNINGSEP